MKTIAITGRSGCGKSRVTAILKEQGYHVADADLVARDVLADGSPCLPLLQERFGADIMDEEGHLRRRLLADRAFKTPEGTQALIDITHPAIVAELNRQGEAARAAGADLYFVDGAVIIGSLFEKECDQFVVVTTPLETSVARICARDGISPEMARRRLDAQVSEEELLAHADYEIRNDGTPEQLAERTLAVLAKLRGTE